MPLRCTLIVCLLFLSSASLQADDEPEKPKPPVPNWVLDGLLSALDDPEPGVAEFVPLIADAMAGHFDFGRPEDKTKAIALAKQLGEFLTHKDRDVRRSAATVLGQLGEAAAKQTRTLVALLKDNGPEVRDSVVKALRQLGEAATAPALVKLLNDPESHVRRSATYLLGQLGGAAASQVPTLVQVLGKLLNDPDWEVRRTAAYALGQLGEAAAVQAQELVELLKENNSHVQKAAAKALAQLGDAGAAQVPALVKLLNDPESHVRRGAVEALGELGEAGAAYAPALVKLLKDDGVRWYATKALRQLGEATAAHAPALVELLKDQDLDVCQSAIHALGQLEQAVPALVELLKEKEQDSIVRCSAAMALANLEESSVALELGELLKDKDSRVRRGAARSLGRLGKAAAKQTSALGDLLKDPDDDLRYEAAFALGLLGKAAADQAPALVALLKDQNSDIRDSAAEALGRFGEAAADQVPALVALLNDEESGVRQSAAQTLGQLGEVAATQAPALAGLLKDPDSRVREAAAEAMGLLKEAAADQAPALGELLNDQYGGVQVAAAKALGQLGEVAATQAPALGAALKDQDRNVRRSAAVALGQLGKTAATLAPALGEILKDQDSDVRQSAGNAIGQLSDAAHTRQGVEPAFVLRMLSRIQRNDISQASAICVGHLACAGDSNGQIVLSLLGKRDPETLPGSNLGDQRKVMQALLEAWQDASTLPPDCNEVRVEVATMIGRVSKSSQWEPTFADVTELKEVQSALREQEKQLPVSGPIAVVTARIEELEQQNRWLTWRDRVWKTVLTHSVFWLALIFAYPRFAWVQSIFFWNPWVRRLLGLGYVGFALAWVPFLRHRLFAPFAGPLLADAGQNATRQESYFPRSQARKLTGKSQGLLQGVLESIPNLKGQIVLQGASGLGKTKFLLHMLAATSRITVFLRADRCTGGVLPAIQAKLKGAARDEKYLTKLIHAGAIDICIDGLNEVNAATRARITHFVEDQYNGNIILTTQPIEWTPPATATIFEIQPLDADQIEDFLITREIPDEADLTQEKYESRCRGFLRRTIPTSRDDSLTNSARRVLSNPMDLTIVSQMLIRDQKPNLLRLQQQQYETMSEDYQSTQKKPFPLAVFSQTVFDMRLSVQSDLPHDQFPAEIEAMQKHRMVVRREIPALDEPTHARPVWRFRHDKVMEFFIVQCFLENSELQTTHFSDERFRGVYFLLANTLPREAAKALREKLIQHAAETKDHNVSDEFILLLKDREELDRLPDQPADEPDPEEATEEPGTSPADDERDAD